jgi:hypothetical protein
MAHTATRAHHVTDLLNFSGTPSNPIQGNHSPFSRVHLGLIAKPLNLISPVCSEAVHHSLRFAYLTAPFPAFGYLHWK